MQGALENLREVADQMQDTAECFARTGNMHMYKNLNYLAQEILHNVEDITKQQSKQLDDQIKQSFQNSKNMLDATLAGMEVAKEL